MSEQLRVLEIPSSGHDSSYDLTDDIAACLADSTGEGMAHVCGIGSTVGVTIMRYEPGAVADLLEVLGALAPASRQYEHERTTRDPNGYSHVRCSLLGTSVCVPYHGGRLLMSDSHRVVLFDFDPQSSVRKVAVSFRGCANDSRVAARDVRP
jgi:secondary thiamine-phosphate synthase enzyme